MAGGTIANLNVKLLANVSGFASGMASTAKPLASFAGDVLSTSGKITGLVGAITGLVGAGSLTALVHQSMEAVDANAKLSDRLGLSTEGLVGLQHAAGLAGVGNEQLTGALEKMLKSLGGAADDGELTSSVFQKLGLDAQALANMPADQSFATIAQRLSEIQNPAERATAAMQIFGKSGQALLPLLMSGSEGIKAAQREAEKLGLTYSHVDAAKVEAANDSMTRMTSIVTGVGNQIAIGLSPYIDAAAVKLTEMATQGGGIGPKVGGAVEWVAKSVAYLSDYLNVLAAGWQVLRGAGSYALGSILDVLGLVVGGVEWLYEKVTGTSSHIGDGMQTFAKAILATGDEAFKKAGENWDAFMSRTNSKAASRAFDDLRASSQAAAEGVAKNAAQMGGAFRGLEDKTANLKKVSETLANLEKQARQTGLSDAAAKLDDLQALGAGPQQLEQAKRFLAVKEQLEAVGKISTDDPLADYAAKMERLQQLYAQGVATAEQFAAIRDTAKKTLDDKLAEQAKQITDSVKTPLEQYQAEIAKLNDLFNRGLITQDTFDRATLKAKSVLEPQAQQAQPPELMRAGSAQAQKLAYELSRGNQKVKDDLGKRQLAQAEASTKFLDRIERNTRPAAASTDSNVVDI